VLEPALAANGEIPIFTDFDVVKRKINRMRKPVYIECMKLRARFDFEYMGLSLQDTSGITIYSHGENPRDWLGLFEKDLDFIQALDSERSYFYDLYNEKRQRLKAFNKFLEKRGWGKNGFQKYLQEIDESLVSRNNEILRALAIAYTSNYHDLPSFLNAEEVLKNAFEAAIESRGFVKFPLFRKLSYHISTFIKTCAYTRKDKDWQYFNTFWDSSYSSYTQEEKRWCWQGYLANRDDLQCALHFLMESGDVRVAENILQQIIRNPTPWTEELIAVRTVQTLSMLDVLNYRKHIARLGDYPEKSQFS
jgi:hypothetical protein